MCCTESACEWWSFIRISRSENFICISSYPSTSWILSGPPFCTSPLSTLSCLPCQWPPSSTLANTSPHALPGQSSRWSCPSILRNPVFQSSGSISRVTRPLQSRQQLLRTRHFLSLFLQSIIMLADRRQRPHQTLARILAGFFFLMPFKRVFICGVNELSSGMCMTAFPFSSAWRRLLFSRLFQEVNFNLF